MHFIGRMVQKTRWRWSSRFLISKHAMFGPLPIQGHYSSMPLALNEVNIVSDRQHPNVFNVQLNRPDKRNTFTPAFWNELKTAFNHLAEHPKCRAIVLTANGPSFCAGIDLRDGIKELLVIMRNDKLDTARKAHAVRKMVAYCQNSFSSLEQCPKPVIAAIHSHCIGAGISLAACADIRFASADALFSIREVDIGIAADVGILQRMHLITGNDSWARDLAFTGRDASAVEAYQYGFLSKVLDSSEDCYEAAFATARQIASKSPIAVQGSKKAMNYARSHSIEDSLEWILNWNAAQLQTNDIVANVNAKLAGAKKTDSGAIPEFEDV